MEEATKSLQCPLINHLHFDLPGWPQITHTHFTELLTLL